MYNYKNGKSNILKILNSPNEVKESNNISEIEDSTNGSLNFENGVRGWISSIFIDIVDSSSLFQGKKDKTIAKIIRAFSSEIVDILNDTQLYRQIGIRGDCVFGVFSTPHKKDIDTVFNMAVDINTLRGMLNSLLEKGNFPKIEYGIGLGCSKDLVIKVGKKRVVNDLVYIGDAVVNASNYSSIANRNQISTIAMDRCFYSNILDLQKESNKDFESWISIEYKKTPYYTTTKEVDFYHCDIIRKQFSDWIRNGMPKE